jgi:Fasciclin domain
VKLTIFSWFTIPQDVSDTLAYTNLTVFLDLLNQANLTDFVDNLHRITIFVPSNAALAAYGATNNTSGQILDLVYQHIVPNFLGYLPALTNGLTLTTLANTTITITVRNGLYFANGVQIIDPDMLTDNGVINVVDGVRDRYEFIITKILTSSRFSLQAQPSLEMLHPHRRALMYPSWCWCLLSPHGYSKCSTKINYSLPLANFNVINHMKSLQPTKYLHIPKR